MDVHERHVEPDRWHATCADVVAGGAGMLDVLAGVDDPAGGCIHVVAHLVDVDARARWLVHTRVPRDQPELDSLVDLLAGAAWHEREAAEMLGVTFTGNPDLRPLLTTGDMGHPLRRTTPLPARVTTPWPGGFDPSDRPAVGSTGRAASRPRSRPGPPGVPAEWAGESQGIDSGAPGAGASTGPSATAPPRDGQAGPQP